MTEFGPKDFGEGRLIRIHKSWLAFIEYCERMGDGVIENLKVQDGLPQIAIETWDDVRFIGELIDDSEKKTKRKMSDASPNESDPEPKK